MGHAGCPLVLGFPHCDSLLIDLGLETDATEDDFGVWEVKTMVAIILHLIESPSGKVPLTTFHLFSWLGECLPLTSSKFPSPRVTFSERPQVKKAPLLPPHPPQLSFLQSLVGRQHPPPHPPPPDPADPHAVSPLRSTVFEA